MIITQPVREKVRRENLVKIHQRVSTHKEILTWRPVCVVKTFDLLACCQSANTYEHKHTHTHTQCADLVHASNRSVKLL